MSEPTYIQVPLTDETAEVILQALMEFKAKGFEVDPYVEQVSDYIVDMRVAELTKQIEDLQQTKTSK